MAPSLEKKSLMHISFNNNSSLENKCYNLQSQQSKTLSTRLSSHSNEDWWAFTVAERHKQDHNSIIAIIHFYN